MSDSKYMLFQKLYLYDLYRRIKGVRGTSKSQTEIFRHIFLSGLRLSEKGAIGNSFTISVDIMGRTR